MGKSSASFAPTVAEIGFLMKFLLSLMGGSMTIATSTKFHSPYEFEAKFNNLWLNLSAFRPISPVGLSGETGRVWRD